MNSITEEQRLFRGLMKGIAAQFGPHCEVVLHDLKDKPYDHTIIAIENGQVTGRRVGDCGTNLGLEVLRGTNKEGDKYNYVTQTRDGKILKSTSIYIRDNDDKVIGALCINFDTTDLIMAEKAINSIAAGAEDGEQVEELFPKDVNELLDDLIQESIRHAGKPVALMTKEDKIAGLRFLDQKGAFLVKKSGDRVSRFYDISKYTLYSYLEEIRNGLGVSDSEN